MKEELRTCGFVEVGGDKDDRVRCAGAVEEDVSEETEVISVMV